MNLTWDRRYEKKWEDLRAAYAKCARCMEDAPYDWCCKHHCGEWTYCDNCQAKCREGNKLCEK